jgi:general secretion pathway protein J
MKTNLLEYQNIMDITGNNTQSGFTLVEILLAMTIFAFVITTLFVTFNTLISGVGTMKAKMEDHKSAQIAMNRIRKDLMALCLTHDPAYVLPDIDRESKPDKFRFVAGNTYLKQSGFSHLRFASFEHLAFNPKDTNRIGIINYYVSESDNGDIVLKRSDTGAVFYQENEPVNPAKDPVLCERVLSFKLEFIDQKGIVKENWDSDSSDFGYGTPITVRIKLELGDEQGSTHFETSIFLPIIRKQDES